MPPRSRRKVEPQQEEIEEVLSTPDLQGEAYFEDLAKRHWLKTTKKQTKVKVKPDVLKSEIWDVLEKENFEFKSLLALENLQILEKYGQSLGTSIQLDANLRTDTYGLVIMRTRLITIFY